MRVLVGPALAHGSTWSASQKGATQWTSWEFIQLEETDTSTYPWALNEAVRPVIEAYLQATNDNPEPFLWTATADEILAKVQRGRVPSTN